MNISDIIALAKQGYKPSDIRDLISIANESEKQPITEPEEKPIDNVDNVDNSVDNSEELEKLKADIEKQKEELAKAQKDLNDTRDALQIAQKANASRDVSENIDDTNTLENIFRDFM